MRHYIINSVCAGVLGFFVPHLFSVQFLVTMICVAALIANNFLASDRID